MNANRVKIYSDTNTIRVHLFQAVLSEHEIHSEILNKKDSSYAGSFGDIEIYVQKDDSVEALKLLEIFLSHGS